MQEERGGLRTEAVLPDGRHPVDSHGFVDVLDAVLNGAHVGVRQSVTISKVHRDAGPRSVSLHRTNTSGLICRTSCSLHDKNTSGDCRQPGFSLL